MSTFVKIFIFVALTISGVEAEPKRDLIAAEKAELAKLAGRTDLTVKEFLRFVADIDAKCTNETLNLPVTAKADPICSMYNKMLKFEELFTENPNGPTWEQCLRAGITSDSLSPDDSIQANVNKIASRLCPQN